MNTGATMAARPGTVPVGRPDRAVPPAPTASVIALAAPPRQTDAPAMSGSMGMILVPAASGVGAVLLAVTHQDRPLMAAAGLLVLAASIAVGAAMLIGSRTGARRRTREQRERYLDYLEQVRSSLRSAVERQISTGVLLSPDPADAAGLAVVPGRRWERRRTDPDFLRLRVGLGAVPRALTAEISVGADDPLTAYEPVCLAAAQELAAGCAPLPAQPVALPFTGGTATCVVGSPTRAAGVVRAVLAQLVWAHSPAEVGLLICRQFTTDWDWVKWLPHAHAARRHDGPLPLRLIVEDDYLARELLAAEAAPDDAGTRRHFLVVLDRRAGPRVTARDETAWMAAALAAQAHLLYLVPTAADQPDMISTRLVLGSAGGPPSDLVQASTSRAAVPDSVSPTRPPAADVCRLDQLSEDDALGLARSFSPLRIIDDSPAEPVAGRAPDHAPLGGVESIDPARGWRPRPPADLLRVPIGAGADGSTVLLDLKESAAGGIGPHGLVVGATGSGKSELLRTLVIAMAIRHPPDDLAFLLVDFKGGATFAELSGLPHLAGTVTNLEAEQGFVDRFRDALGGELRRRQELLAAAGGVTSLAAYRDLRRRRPDLTAVPHLLVIVDEFSELLGARPDLAELFVTIGRIGRSIGVHLLLATQRLDTGRIRGLESHLSFRICLRTFSEAESREAIGRPDAHHLPAEPGWAYLLGDGPEPRRFRAATVSVPVRRPSTRADPVALVLPFDAGNGVGERAADLHRRTHRAVLPTAPGHPRGVEPTALDIAVERVITGAHVAPNGAPARRIWLDPLPELLPLTDPGRHESDSRMVAILGMVDRPAAQRQDRLEWDFTSGNSNLLIVGAGRSGKSTGLQTVLAALCLRYTPGDLELLCVDHGGQGLLPWSELPHVAAVGSRTEPELTRRIFLRLGQLLAERELLFREHRFASTADLRRARRDGTVDPTVPGDVVLFVDGWASVRDAHEDMEAVLNEILVRGPGLGVHTVLTVAAPHQLRSRLAGAFGHRIELRLADSFDSAFDRGMAKALPLRVPGRALVAGPAVAQLAQPFLAAGSAADEVAGSGAAGGPAMGRIEHTMATILDRWPERAVPRIRTLPAAVTLAQLEDLAAGGMGPPRSPGELLLGLAEDGLQPVRWTPATDDPHLLIVGDTRSGKTTLLRCLLHQLLAAQDRRDDHDHDDGDRVDHSGTPRTTEPPTVLVIDYRRRLTGLRSTDRLTVATTPATATDRCSTLARQLAERTPDGAGPPIYVVVDDYELVASATGNPLRPLMPWLARSADLNLHLLLARRVGGAARAMYEPVLQTLADLGTPVLLFSGPAAEGRFAHGTAPAVLPPGRARLTARDRPPQLLQVPLPGPAQPAPARHPS